MQDEVESFVVKLLRGGFAYTIGSTGDDRVGRWTLEVSLPAIRGSEEVEPQEIENASQLCKTHGESYIMDDAGHGGSGREREGSLGTSALRRTLNTGKYDCGPSENLSRPTIERL